MRLNVGGASNHLVDHAVPGEAGIVHNDMDLAVAELGGLLHELRDIAIPEHITRYSCRAATIVIDLFGYTFRFAWVDRNEPVFT